LAPPSFSQLVCALIVRHWSVAAQRLRPDTCAGLPNASAPLAVEQLTRNGITIFGFSLDCRKLSVTTDIRKTMAPWKEEPFGVLLFGVRQKIASFVAN
jgi:hypothetical protein